MVLWGAALLYLVIVCVPVVLPGRWNPDDVMAFIKVVLVPVLVVLVGIAYRIEDMPYGPVPSRIRTFRQLAELIEREHEVMIAESRVASTVD